jgi:hypothetical protein
MMDSSPFKSKFALLFFNISTSYSFKLIEVYISELRIPLVSYKAVSFACITAAADSEEDEQLIKELLFYNYAA